jgi:tetratricopeptide (TPR) repeat protein
MDKDRPLRFFTVGGTLSLDAVYVERQPDEQLFQAALSGEYCNVLTPRQMGKSSLMVRTSQRLQEEGAVTATIDLTDIGTIVDAGEWYFGLISRLQEQLQLDTDIRTWWQERDQQGAVQRFSDFLHDVLLRERSENIVIFVDEIDSTLGLPFTDDFFAVIRAAYNARARDPQYRRLAFVLLGVARPSDLIKDRSRTPYNIGQSIDLKDFSMEESSVLLPGLEAGSEQNAREIMARVHYWSGGHPYLTQKICDEIARDGRQAWSEEEIAILVRRLFLSEEARKESNLQYIADRIRESPDREKLLSIYSKVRSGKSVPDEERDPVRSQLKLSGLVISSSRGELMVRNRIYETVFNKEWIKDNTPTVTTKRIILAAVAVIVLSLLAGIYIINRQQNSDDIQAQAFTQGFATNTSPAVRVSNLAGLFALDGDYTSQARELFSQLPPAEQLALFSELANPEQSGVALQTVIGGIYAALDNNQHNNALLKEMADKLDEIKAAYPDSTILAAEIRTWLKGRESFNSGEYTTAVDTFTQAITYSGQNPGIYIDRALAAARGADYGPALGDLNQAVELDVALVPQVKSVLDSNAELQQYLSAHSDEFPELVDVAAGTQSE